MAKVSDKELNECIAQAITEVLKEDWEDDVVNAAINDKRARKAFEKDKKKEDDAEAADDAKNAAADEADKAVADDEEGGEEEAQASKGTAYSDVREMSYEELLNILNTEKRGTALFRAATREKMDRDAIMKDKEDILNGELVMPYGWEFDESGYPVRAHEFKKPDVAEFPDTEAMQGLNFHWLKPRMSVHGEELDNQDVGMPNANFYE